MSSHGRAPLKLKNDIPGREDAEEMRWAVGSWYNRLRNQRLKLISKFDNSYLTFLATTVYTS